MFLNREEAGTRLAVRLSSEKAIGDSSIIAIPRGGVVVGKAISEILGIPLGVLIVKKIGAPQNPELAIGATGSDGMVFWDEKLMEYLGVSEKEKEEALLETIRTIKEREEGLGIKIPNIKGKIALVVDDGVATGATAISTSMILKKLGAKKVILATPVISRRTKKELEEHFDKIVSVETPREFGAVGQFYQEFPQVEDEEVRKLLKGVRGTKSTRGIRS